MQIMDDSLTVIRNDSCCFFLSNPPAAVTRRRLQPPQNASVMLEMTWTTDAKWAKIEES